jgi:hypothetical protein
MTIITREYAKDLKAIIFDKDEKTCKKILFRLVEFLTKHHSISKNVFVDIIFETYEYHKDIMRNST